MDPDKRVKLSCAPFWAHPTPKNVPWRDHWMQAIYYPISDSSVSSDRLTIISNHDEYSFWFDVRDGDDYACVSNIPMPSPQAGIHLAVSRNRLGQINDEQRNGQLVRSSEAMLDDFYRANQRLPSAVLCLSELSLLPVIFGHIFESKSSSNSAQTCTIYLCEQNTQMSRILADFARLFKNVKLILMDADIAELKPDHFSPKVSELGFPCPKQPFLVCRWIL